MRLRLISADDLRRLVPMADAVDAMARAFAQLSAGAADVPLRTAVDVAGGTALFMPGHLPGTDASAPPALGAKVVSVFPANRERGRPAVHALVLLLDPATGAPVAALEGASLTALRTGAASGLATRLLALPGTPVLAVFGAGAQAVTQIEAVRAVRRVEEVRIVSRSGDSARALAARLEGVRARAVADPAEAVRGAGVICTATDSQTPVFPADAVDPGTHVNAVGAYTTAMREVEGALVRRARVVVDQREAALAEAGDLTLAVDEGALEGDPVDAELGEVVAGTRPGRTSPDQVTLFKSVGSAAQDLAVAAVALERAQAEGAGTVFGL